MEMLKEISIYNQENSITDIIIVGDLNKAINSNTIEKWFIENRIYDIHYYINETKNQRKDSTYKFGSKCINTIAASIGIMKIVNGCILLDFEELIISNHRGFIVDLDLEEYFNTIPSYYDEVDYSKLDSSRKSHLIKFCDVLEVEIIKRNIDERINNITNKTTKEELEWIDNDLTFEMNATCKVVEGPQ